MGLTLLMGAHAQAERGGGKGKWTTSLYGGFSFPTPRFVDGSGSVQGYPGVTFGFGVEAQVMSAVGVQMNVLYANKGYELQDANLTRYPASYLTIPVELNFSPTEFVNLHFGPYLASLVMSAEKFGGGKILPASGMFATDFGLTCGLWLGFRATNKLKIGLDMRYDFGLADIQHDGFPEDKLYTRTFSSLMTFGFNF